MDYHKKVNIEDCHGDYDDKFSEGLEAELADDMPINGKLSLYDDGNLMAKFEHRRSGLVKLNDPPSIWGFSARNLEQTYALHDLLDKTKLICMLTGKAGTGKNLLAFLAFLWLARKEGKKVLYCRDAVDMGHALGFRPGETDEKADGYFGPAYDTLTKLSNRHTDFWTVEDWVRDGFLEMLPLAELRGRTFDKTYMILDEVQNTSVSDTDSFITRMGEGSKVVLLGSQYQKDDPKLKHNGLATAEILAGLPYFSHVNLVKNERNPMIQEVDDRFLEYIKKHNC